MAAYVIFFTLTLRDAPTGLTLKNCTLCPHRIYVFCYLSVSKQLHGPRKIIDFYNRNEKCLLRGKNWVFKLDNMPFVFKGFKGFPTQKFAVMLTSITGKYESQAASNGTNLFRLRRQFRLCSKNCSAKTNMQKI